jgi:rhodanese-related sulfurtransferase
LGLASEVNWGTTTESPVVVGRVPVSVLPEIKPQNPLNQMKKLLTTLAGIALTTITALAGSYPDISIAELKKAIDDKKVVLIDVNGSDSFKSGHIPSAVNFADVKGDLSKVLPKEKDALVVAYCGGPSCNAYQRAADAASKLGYTNIKHLSAGISGWLKASEKVEK